MSRQLHVIIAKMFNDPIVEQRTCPYTGEVFSIHQSYIDLLEQVSPTINGKKYPFPLPEMSPSVRERIRTMFRNEKKFYTSTSSLSQKRIVSLYAPESNITVYTTKERRDDANDPMKLGKEIKNIADYEKILQEINDTIPRLNIMTSHNENSEYTSGTGYCKDCYLICASEYAEKCYYSKLLQTAEHVVDSLNIFQSEWLYECINCKKCSHSGFLKNSSGCYQCRYGDQLIGCSNCLLCTGLVNKQYYYKNKPISKEAFEEKKKQLEGNYITHQAYLQAYLQMLQRNTVKYADVINGEKVIGDSIFDSKECFFTFNINESEKCQCLTVGEKCRKNIDCNNMYINPEKSYNVLGTINTFDVHCSLYIFDSEDMLYCQDCYNCKHCFGCFGLRNKEYCIFNKQYEKQKYYELLEQLLQQMQADKTWGNYFPNHFTQFPYNDTVAMEYYPVEKVVDTQGNETIINHRGTGTVYLLEEGFIVNAELDLGGIKRLPIKRRTKETETNIPEHAQTIKAEDLPDNINDIDDDITEKIILCKESGRPYRIIKQELAFYRTMKLPLPRLHQDIRYEHRLAQLAGRKLSPRECDHCKKEIISVYPETYKGKVLCEQCYVKEIYG